MARNLLAELQLVSDQSPIHLQLGLVVKECAGDLALRASLDRRSANAADGAVAHGGILAVILDAAATLALTAATGDDWTTVDLRVDYLRPVSIGAVEARGSVLHAGRTLGRAQGRVLDDQQRVCATAIGTFRRGPTVLPVGGV
ncbi:MAG: PaaI family thioesterase [Candidatus Dormibacteria bacterium]